MKKNLIVPAVIVVLLAGCRPEENGEQLKAVNRSLEYANGVMQNANNLVYEDFLEKKKDLNTGIYTWMWESKAKQIGQYADSIRILIKNIKDELIKQSGNLKRDNVDLTKQLYSPGGIGDQLLNKLIAFRDSVPAIFNSGDKMVYTNFQDQLNNLLKTVPLLPAYGDSLPGDKKRDYKSKWLQENFGRSTSLNAMVMLNKIESDVLATENAFIVCCKNQIAIGCNLLAYRFSAITSLNSSYVKAGQSIEITAGVGSITDAAKPRITINGKEVTLNTDATAVYKFVATGKPGKHTIPVIIEFTKPGASKEIVTKNLKYIIAEN